MSKFFYNIADKTACFSINYKILVIRDTINKCFYWLVTNTPQWSSLNENSFCKTEKENLLINIMGDKLLHKFGAKFQR